MKKIFLSGVCGLIGSHLADELIKTHFVVGIDNLSLGTKDNIKHLLTHKNFRFHQVDILDAKECENIFRIYSFDAIFHLAANSDISNQDPKKDFQNTLSTTLVLLEKCRVRGIKQFIFTSSGSVYGETKNIVKEDLSCNPISHYAACKLSSEAFISSYCSMYGIQSWVLRLPNVVGERATHGVIYDFIKQLKKNPKELRVLGNGLQSKPFMYVKDLIDAMLFVWRNAKEPLNIYNIRGEEVTKVKYIAEQVVKAMNLDAKIVYGEEDRGWAGDVPQYCPSISKLIELGWEPKLTSNEAVRIALIKML